MTQTIERQFATSAAQILWFYKTVMVGILLIGAGLDIILLLAGPGPLLRYVFTTAGELLLTAWMATALVLGLVAYPHLDLHRRATRIVQQILLVYFVLLVLVHGVNNLLLGNSAGYLAAFSAPAYPYVATVVLLAAALFTARMRQQEMHANDFINRAATHAPAAGQQAAQTRAADQWHLLDHHGRRVCSL
ncbi:MAG: hypothetical protein R2932_45640 [Caldilineaceae bacterium]